MSVPKVLSFAVAATALTLLVSPVSAQPSRSDSAIVFSGEVRARGEYDRPGSGVSGDGVTLLRSRFAADARVADGARVFVQLQDSRVLGERSTTAGSAAQLDLHQAFLELTGTWEDRRLALRVGRQEIALGNERLIGAVGWSNTGRTFDGARVDLTSADAAWRASAFAITLGENGRRAPKVVAGEPTRSDESLLGLTMSRGRLEALLVHDRGVRFRAFDEVRRTTGYARYRTAPTAGIVLDVESAYQFGTQQRVVTGDPRTTRAQDISAWFLGARLNRPADDAVPAAFTVGVDWLSGDDNPADGDYSGFNTLYGTNHKWYGTIDLFLDPNARTGDRGLIDVMAGTVVTLSPRATLRADVHHLRAATAGVSAIDRSLGWEGDVSVPVQLSKASSVEIGYSVFRTQSGFSDLGLGESGALRHWGYLQLGVRF